MRVLTTAASKHAATIEVAEQTAAALRSGADGIARTPQPGLAPS